MPSLPAGMVHAQRQDNLSIMSNGWQEKFIQAKKFHQGPLLQGHSRCPALYCVPACESLGSHLLPPCPPPPRPAIRYLPRAKGPTDVEVRRVPGFFTPEHIRPLGSLGAPIDHQLPAVRGRVLDRP